MNRPLPQSFYLQPTITVARELLGCILARRWQRGWLTGGIVETEAYLAKDPANRASWIKQKNKLAMFGSPGNAFVYTIHAHFLLNAVTQEEGVPEAVLLRALEPLTGIDEMIRARGTDRLRDLARGPGRLCRALRIDLSFNERPLTRGDLVILPRREPIGRICAAPRIGLREGTDRKWRFYLARSEFVSRP